MKQKVTHKINSLFLILPNLKSDQNTSFIDKCNHYSFQNRLIFDLIMFSYHSITQNVKIIVQNIYFFFLKNALLSRGGGRGSAKNPVKVWWDGWVSGDLVIFSYLLWDSFWGKITYFRTISTNFFLHLCIRFCTFLLKDNQIRWQYQVWEWYIEKCKIKFCKSNFKD